MKSEVKKAITLLGGAAMLVVAVGCGHTSTSTKTPSSNVTPAPSSSPQEAGIIPGPNPPITETAHPHP